MAATRAASVPQHLDCLRSGRDGFRLTDGELLERFISARDEAAFEDLLQRHGPMVLGVCRRTLRNEADADDAFQATFLVLVRKAASIRPRSMVGNWLYGVAHNTALKARAMSTKRSTKEHEAAGRTMPLVAGPTWEHLQPVLDQELKALPDKYRSAIILCDLEGKSLKEAARQLGCPLATVATRVTRGRVMLAQRLNRRKVAFSAGALALMLSQNAASAAVPADLVASTTKAAAVAIGESSTAGSAISAQVAALTAAMLRALLLARLKLTVLMLLFVSAIAVAGAWAAQANMPGGAITPRKPRPDNVRLQHTWTLVSVQHAGQEVPKAAFKCFEEWTFGAVKIDVVPSAIWSGVYKIDAAKVRKEIDFCATNVVRNSDLPPLHGAGIYKLEGSTLTICLAAPTTESGIRPNEFVSKPGEQMTTLFVLERKRTESDRCGSSGKVSRHVGAHGEGIRREGR